MTCAVGGNEGQLWTSDTAAVSYNYLYTDAD